MNKTCEMTMESDNCMGGSVFFECGKPAKYITPKDPMKGKKIYVCGIHRNSVDAFHKRTGSNKRCKKLYEATKNQKV